MSSIINLRINLARAVLVSSLLAPPHPQNFVVAEGQTEERPTGLLALPEVFGDSPCMQFQPKNLDLYEAPSLERPAIAFIERLNPPRPPERPDCDEPRVVVKKITDKSIGEPLPTDESGYEMPNAIVYEQSGLWFRIALTRGSAWIQRQNRDGFLTYPDDLTTDSFSTYLRRNWDGSIWAVPGAGTGMPAPPEWRAHAQDNLPIRITSTQVVRGEKWIRVHFMTETCGQPLGNLPALEAWIPAYRTLRTTSVWFYSRGC